MRKGSRVRGLNTTLDEVKLEGRNFKAVVTEAVIGANLERTIEGASTVTIDIHDPESKFLRRALVRKRFDLEIDGLWFRLVALDKAGETLTLTFEDRAVAYMRQYDKPVKAFRDQVTRAEFVKMLVREVKEERIPLYIPELHKEQPIEDAGKRRASIQIDKGEKRGSYGLKGADITVKGQKASKTQVSNIERVLDVGISLDANKKVLVSAVMTITQESNCENLSQAQSDGDSAGLFQQRPDWPGDPRNIENAAKNYYKGFSGHDGAIAVDKKNPGYSLAQVCQAVQVSAYPDAYSQWEKEAKKTVAEYTGGSPLTSGTATLQVAKRYAFSRGQGKKRENTWSCTGRLAEEVRWRRFMVAGIFYYVSEQKLFRSQPWKRLNEDTEGVDWVDFRYDMGKKVQEVTVTARVKQWSAPPGTVIHVRDMGPASGRYIIASISTSLFEPTATITLKKPMKALPEPAPEFVTKTSAFGDSDDPTGGRGGGNLKSLKIDPSKWGGSEDVIKKYVDPFLKRYGLNPGSRKRPYNTGSGTSDHWVGSKQAYATDYPTTSGEKAARALAKAMGFSAWQPNSYASFTITVDGYKFQVQILWGAAIAHGDHVHVGLHRV